MVVPTISVKMSVREREAIDAAVLSGHALNVSDYIRQAIREKLKRDRGE